jgi:hypothetical protein
MAVNTQLNTATVPFPVFKNVVNISSAQVLAMYTTPVLLVPAQGAHKVIFVHDVFVEYIYGGVAYANGSGFAIQYTSTGSDGGLIIINSNIDPNGSASDFGGDPGVPFTNSDVVASYVNQGIYASTTINNFITGNGTFRVTIFYTVVTTTA